MPPFSARSNDGVATRSLRASAVVLLLLSAAATPGHGERQAARVPAEAGVDVRVYGMTALGEGSRTRMRTTAESLLRAAGISMRWYDCSAPHPDDACSEPVGRRVIIVRLVETATGPAGTCGQSVRGSRPFGGLVSVHAPCVAAVVHSMRSQPGTPTLMRLEEGHVLAVVIVHEIGHLLGEAHTPAGIMRPVMRQVEWEQLLRQRLAFSSRQARMLRAAAASVLEAEVARRR